MYVITQYQYTCTYMGVQPASQNGLNKVSYYVCKGELSVGEVQAGKESTNHENHDRFDSGSGLDWSVLPELYSV